MLLLLLLLEQLLPLLIKVAQGRLTPGDPLEGLQQVALTSNGVLLDQDRAVALAEAEAQRLRLARDPRARHALPGGHRPHHAQDLRR